MEYEVNDWVQHNRTSYKGSVVGIEGDYVRVHWFLYNGGRPLRNQDIDIHHNHELKPLPPEPKEFSYDVLDVALLTNDQEWIKEIVSLKGEEANEQNS